MTFITKTSKDKEREGPSLQVRTRWNSGDRSARRRFVTVELELVERTVPGKGHSVFCLLMCFWASSSVLRHALCMMTIMMMMIHASPGETRTRAGKGDNE
jgi:hypothetical protein